MNASLASAPAPGWRWAPAWVIAFVALWPAPGYAEGVLVLGALAGLSKLVASRFRGGAALLGGPAWALTSVLFFAYWLPQLLSAPDALDRGRAFQEAVIDLRYLPFLWVVASAVANEQGRRRTFGGLAIIMLAWTVDALLEAFLGTSPLFWSLDQAKQAISGHGMCTAADLAAADRLGGRRAHRPPGRAQPFGLRRRPVVSADLVTGLLQMDGHRAAHDAQADEGDRAHRRFPSPHIGFVCGARVERPRTARRRSPP